MHFSFPPSAESAAVITGSSIVFLFEALVTFALAWAGLRIGWGFALSSGHSGLGAVLGTRNIDRAFFLGRIIGEGTTWVTSEEGTCLETSGEGVLGEMSGRGSCWIGPVSHFKILVRGQSKKSFCTLAVGEET